MYKCKCKCCAALFVFLLLVSPALAEDGPNPAEPRVVADTFIFVSPHSGPLAPLADSARNGAELALKTWGGGFNLTQFDENSAEALPFLGRAPLVAGYFTEKRLNGDLPGLLFSKKPVLLPFLTNPEASAASPETFFNLMPSEAQQGEFLALGLLKQKKRPKNILILVGPQPPSRALAEAFTAALADPPPPPKPEKGKAPPALKPLDAKAVLKIEHLAVASDIAALTGEADWEKNPPDFLLLALDPLLALEAAPLLARFKLAKTPLYGGVTLANRELGSAYTVLGLQLNLCLPVNPADDKNKALNEFHRRYLTTYNQKAPWTALAAYDTLNLAIKASSAAGPSGLPSEGPLSFLSVPAQRHMAVGSYGLLPGGGDPPIDLLRISESTLPFLP